MFSKQEAGILKQQFWTSLGKYLAPIPSSEGQKINWINYKTGIRFVNLKMDAFADHAYIGIELSHKEAAVQQVFFNHFKTLKDDIEKSMGEEWIWQPLANIDGRVISRIYTELPNVNIYRQTDWPEIISFLKTRMILLDEFWNRQKDIFEMMS